MRLVVFGAGYVGLVSGTGLSDLGHDVLVYDIDPRKIADLREGRVPIYEPGLGDLIHRNQRCGRLHFASTITAPFDAADAYFIAVGTPPNDEGAADLTERARLVLVVVLGMDLDQERAVGLVPRLHRLDGRIRGLRLGDAELWNPHPELNRRRARP